MTHTNTCLSDRTVWPFPSRLPGVPERKAIVEAEDWEGPDFQTCMNAASVCRAFETSRRREVLSFRHYAEVAGPRMLIVQNLFGSSPAVKFRAF